MPSREGIPPEGSQPGRLKELWDDVLQVGESSLSPALQRLLLKDWVKANGARRTTIGAHGRQPHAIPYSSERADAFRELLRKVAGGASTAAMLPSVRRYSHGGPEDSRPEDRRSATRG